MLSRNCISAPGPLRELEAVEQLVCARAARGRRPCGARAASPSRCRSGRASSRPCAPQAAHDARGLVARPATSTPTKMCASLRVGDAVVELGDVALAEQRRRTAGSCPGARGSSPRAAPRAARRARRARRRSAGGRSSCWRRRRSRRASCPAHAVLLDPGLGAGDRERAGRLEHDARVLEHVLDRRADLVGVDEHDLVDAARGTGGTSPRPTCFTATPSANRPTWSSVHAPSRLERARHRVGVHRLDADDP